MPLIFSLIRDRDFLYQLGHFLVVKTFLFRAFSCLVSLLCTVLSGVSAYSELDKRFRVAALKLLQIFIWSYSLTGHFVFETEKCVMRVAWRNTQVVMQQHN
jgi:hypothetical protein